MPARQAEITRILRALRSLSADDRDRRTLLLRDLGAATVDLREHFTTDAGEPDWPGRTGGYRAAIQSAYSAAGYAPDDAALIQKRARYHIAAALRQRLSPSEVAALGLTAKGPRERQTEIRERNAAIVAAARAIGTSGNDALTNGDAPPPGSRLAAMQQAAALLNGIRFHRKTLDAARPEDAKRIAAARRVLRAIIARAQTLLRVLDERYPPTD